MKDLGRTGKYKANGFSFLVAVKNSRVHLGQLEYLIVPVAGAGESWVSHALVTLDEPATVEAPGSLPPESLRRKPGSGGGENPEEERP